MQACDVLWEGSLEFMPSAFMNQEVDVHVHLPQVLEKLKWNERLTTENGGCVFSNEKNFETSFQGLINVLSCALPFAEDASFGWQGATPRQR